MSGIHGLHSDKMPETYSPATRALKKHYLNLFFRRS